MPTPQAETANAVLLALTDLPDIEFRVICLRYGLRPGRLEKAPWQIAALLPADETYVRELEVQALRRLAAAVNQTDTALDAAA